MRKKLLLATFVLSFAANVFAQVGTETNTRIPFNGFDASLFKRNTASNERTTTCSPDTVLYSYLKELNADPTGNGLWLDAIVGPRRAWSQGYELNASATISGITFYGFVYDRANPAQTISAKVYLYNVDALYMPTTKVDSAVVTVTTTPALYSVNFTTPIIRNSNFAVGVANPLSTDTLGVIMNNADVTTYGEGLGWRRFGSGAWNTSLAYAGQDAEPIIAAHMTFNVTADYTVSPSAAVCLGNPFSFTNTSVDTNSIESRFYSYNAFKAYWSPTFMPDSVYAWDMGDGSVIWNKQVPSYTYASAGVNTVSLFAITGLFTGCVDTKATSVTINAIDDATITAVSAFCENDAAMNLTAATAGGTWSGTGITSASAGTFSPSVAGPGTFTITYTTAGTCPDTNNISIVVNAQEDATISDPGMICSVDAAFNLTAATSGGTWSGTGITSASAGTFDPAVAGAGAHLITYVTPGTCTGTDTLTIFESVCSGINGHDAATVVSVYPNPSDGIFTVDLGMSIKSTVEVYNVLGAKVFAKEFNTQLSSVDVTGLDAGVYVLKVKTDKNQAIKQITIKK